MIRINLLPQRRARLKAAVAITDQPGARDFFIGVGALAAAAFVVFFVVDYPNRSRISQLRASIDEISKEMARKQQDLTGYAEMKKASDEADTRVASINKLNAVSVVPANVLHELGEILTQNHLPTMTEQMARKTGNGPDSDPNKRFDLQWDPSHVWITSFVDANGGYKVEGGAESEIDVTQLSKRLAASVYFGPEIAVPDQHRENDKDTGISYFKFTITGKVAY